MLVDYLLVSLAQWGHRELVFGSKYTTINLL
mgnify:CR=1 FL=1